MQSIRSPFDVTLAPAHVQNCCAPPNNLNNLAGSNIPDDECFRKNQIYKGNGGVCQTVMRECVCPSTVVQQKRIDDFCGPSATPGFYHNGAFWSIN